MRNQKDRKKKATKKFELVTKTTITHGSTVASAVQSKSIPSAPSANRFTAELQVDVQLSS